MLREKIMGRFLAALLIISLLGCVPDSDNPLTAPNKQEIDSSILGTWFWKDGGETGYLHIGLNEKSKLLRIIMVDIDRGGDLDVSEFSGHTSSLGGKNYLNIKSAQPMDEQISGYTFVKYTLRSDTLGLSLMNNDVVEKAIKGGAIRGDVKRSKQSPSAHIREGQRKLQEFVLREDRELFQEMKYLSRLILPSD